MATSNPIDLAADIVKSFVSNNSVPWVELAALIEAVHAAVKRLAGPSEAAAAVSEPPTPAVSVRKSVTPDHLICLDDGRRFKSLRRHLATLGMTPEQYRAKWSLPSDYPMVAPNYAAQRSAFAKNIGFGLREKPIAAPPASAAAIEAVTDTIEVIAPERRASTRSRWLQSSRRPSPSAKPGQRPRARWSRPRRRSR
jgi:predicted transcriptional regulator